MVILCCKPYFVYAHHGYARVCLVDYSQEEFGNNSKPLQLVIHQPNLNVQKRHPNFDQLKEETTISIPKLKESLISEGRVNSDAHFKEAVVDRMNEAMRLCFLAVKGKLDRRFGCYEIFAVDFVLERESLQPRLIDFTSNPSYSTELEGNSAVIYNLLRDATTMASDLHEFGNKFATPQRLKKVFRCTTMNYEVLYRE